MLKPAQIISELYTDQRVAAGCTLENNFIPRKKFNRSLGGVAGGAVLAGLLETTGPLVALHEIVGHGLLGYEMTSQSGQSPTYVVDGWENLKAIGKAGSFKEGVIDFFQWITGHDTYGNGALGMAYIPPSNPNGMGQAMGRDGRDAWISIAGSLPGLAVDTLSVVGGMHLRKRSPVVGNALVAMGLTDGIINATYPISAAVMSPSEMRQQAHSGHDFANFAVQMSHVLGVSAQAVAISTAMIWTGVVPIAALLAYLSTKSEAGEIVPEALAMKRWLQKAATDPKIGAELEQYSESYLEKEELASACQKIRALKGKRLTPDKLEIAQHLAIGFIEYLLDHIPNKTIEKEKMEILDEWGKNVKPDRIQTALTGAAIAGSTLAVATKVLQVFSDTIAPSLSTTVTALTYASPLFVGASVLSAAYQVYKDFQCPDTIVPQKAKVLSVARLIVSIVTAVLILMGLFMPGLNLLFIGALLIGSIANIALAYARSRIIQKQFKLIQALKPDTWNVMNALWRNHQKKPPGTKMSRPLKQWHDCVKHLPNLKLPEIPDRPLLFQPLERSDQTPRLIS